MRRMVGVALALLVTARVSAHDLERTQVSLAFARDGSFVLDVANDPNWLKLRLEPFGSASFADRVVLFVDGHEVRPTSVEYLAPAARPEPVEGPATHRLRGRMPLDARTLRWYYGLVIDPYPLTIRRADGRIVVEEIGGDAWSRTIDVSGQFRAPRTIDRFTLITIVGLFLTPLLLRLASRLSPRNHESTKARKRIGLGFRDFVFSRFRG